MHEDQLRSDRGRTGPRQGTGPPTISYQLSRGLRWVNREMLAETARADGAAVVAELGGGAKPVLADTEAWSFARSRVIFDLSAEELDKADGGLDKRQADLCRPLPPDTDDAFDFVFSKMLCEHLADPETFHRNCHRMLRPGGLAVHYYPTLYALPFVLNRVLPEHSARRLLQAVQPGRLDDPLTEKFPAYYRWCRGPTDRSIRRYTDIGFRVERWIGAYGHDYYNRVPVLGSVERAKSSILVRHPVPWLTSFAFVVLRKE